MSEAQVDRFERLEEDVREIKATLVRLEPLIISINAQFPHLATKAELTTGLAELRDEISKLRVEIADKPGRGYLWGVMGAMVGAQAVALAAAALIFSIVQARAAVPVIPSHVAAASVVLAAEPFDWDRYHDRQDACLEADRIAAACTQGYCDELALRQAQRACSAFTGERR